MERILPLSVEDKSFTHLETESPLSSRQVLFCSGHPLPHLCSPGFLLQVPWTFQDPSLLAGDLTLAEQGWQAALENLCFYKICFHTPAKQPTGTITHTWSVHPNHTSALPSQLFLALPKASLWHYVCFRNLNLIIINRHGSFHTVAMPASSTQKTYS